MKITQKYASFGMTCIKITLNYLINSLTHYKFSYKPPTILYDGTRTMIIKSPTNWKIGQHLVIVWTFGEDIQKGINIITFSDGYYPKIPKI